MGTGGPDGTRRRTRRSGTEVARDDDSGRSEDDAGDQASDAGRPDRGCHAVPEQTPDSLAQRLGVTAAEVGHWADDREVPTGAQVGVVAGYLGISDDEVRRLVLRSQMRNVQRDIRRSAEAAGGRS